MRRRLLLSYVALTVLVLLLLEVPLGLLETRQEHEALAATGRRDATALSVLATEALAHPDDETGITTLASRYQAEAGAELAIMDASGRVLVALDPDEATPRSRELVPLMRAALRGTSSTVRRTDEGEATLVTVMPVRSAAGKVVGAVAVAVPAAATDRRIRQAWLALALLAVVLIAIACGVGLVLARSLTAPLTRLQGTARRLGTGDLTARAPTDGPREIAEVAEEFNEMADQLAGLVDSQRRFVADASHQLRTPLTALRLRLENMADLGGPAAADIEACEAEVDRLARLVDGLLALSRAEGKPGRSTTADVGAVVVDRVQGWAALAAEQGVDVGPVERPAGSPALVAIDPDHLEQILDNILANAVEASPPGTAITVTVEVAGAIVTVRVQDQGPGLRADERERAFDRFWQGADGATGSSGLGLAIVRELALAAHGSVSLGAAPGGGLEVRVDLPLAGGPRPLAPSTVAERP